MYPADYFCMAGMFYAFLILRDVLRCMGLFWRCCTKARGMILDAAEPMCAGLILKKLD